jgi:hypothetical protein
MEIRVSVNTMIQLSTLDGGLFLLGDKNIIDRFLLTDSSMFKQLGETRVD